LAQSIFFSKDEGCKYKLWTHIMHILGLKWMPVSITKPILYSNNYQDQYQDQPGYQSLKCIWPAPRCVWTPPDTSWMGKVKGKIKKCGLQ
jgi:hypothetical protein